LYQHLYNQQQLNNQQNGNINDKDNTTNMPQTYGNVSQNQNNNTNTNMALQYDKGHANNQKIDLKKLMMVSMKSETSNGLDFYKRSIEQKLGHTPPVQTMPGGKCLDLNVALPELKKNFD